MIVRGNVKPEIYRIEFYPPDKSKAIVFLRENIKKVKENDIVFYEYDEYQVITKITDNLDHDVNENIEEWFKTGRCLEGVQNV